MQAGVKPLVLPEVPKYEGNIGKPLDSCVEVFYTNAGKILECKRHAEPPRPLKLDYRPRKRMPSLTPEETARIHEMMDEGKGTKEITEAIGKPDYTIKRYKRQIRAGIIGKG